MTTITADCFDKKTVARADLPTGRLVSATGSLRAILAVSVVSNPKTQDAKSKASNTSHGLVVTLLVDPKQAEALQLASDNRTISLAIRNPPDKKLGDMEATVLSQGQLANISSALTPEVLASAQRYREETERNGIVSQSLPSGGFSGRTLDKLKRLHIQRGFSCTDKPGQSGVSRSQGDSVRKPALCSRSMQASLWVHHNRCSLSVAGRRHRSGRPE